MTDLQPSLRKLIQQRLSEGAAWTRDYQAGGEHYKKLGVQPWDVIDTWPTDQQIGYHRGNILKYTMRLGAKDNLLKEAKKIRHYAEKLIEVLEKSA